MADIIEYLQNRVNELKKQVESLDRSRALIEIEMEQVTELYRATQAVLRAELAARGIVTTEQEPWAATRQKLQTLTLKDAIWAIVSGHGEQGVHANHILKTLQDAGFPLKGKSPKNSIVSVIYHEMKDHGTYERIAPNTFRVVEQPGETAVQAVLAHMKKD